MIRFLGPGGEISAKRAAIALMAICIIATAIRIPLLRGRFLPYDDVLMIQDNPVVKHLTWHNVALVLTTNYRNEMQNPMHFANMLNWAVTPNRFAGFVVFNLIWLAFTTFAAYAFAALFVESRLWRLFAAAAFALNCVNADTIPWMAARCHFLGLPFLLFAFIYWRRYVEEPARTRKAVFYGLALLSGAFAISNKGIFISVGGLIVLYDVYRRRRLGLTAVLDKLPLLALGAIVSRMSPVRGRMAYFDDVIPAKVTAGNILLNNFGQVVEAIHRVVVPGPVTVVLGHYPAPDLFTAGAGTSSTAMSLPPFVNVAILLAATALLLWLALRQRIAAPLFLAVTATIFIAPVLNTSWFWPGLEFNYRYALLPSVFFGVAVAAVLERVWPRMESAWAKRGVAIYLAAWLAWHAGWTLFSATNWRSPQRYWETCAARFPDSTICIAKAGDQHFDKGQIEAAISDYARADALQEDLGVKLPGKTAKVVADLYRRLGDGKKAREYYERSLARDKLAPDEIKEISKILAESDKASHNLQSLPPDETLPLL